MLFTATGWPTAIPALALNQFPLVTVEETGAKVPATSLDQLVLLGQIGGSGVLTAHVEGGKHNGYGVQIDITGADGDLRITNHDAFDAFARGNDYRLEGARRGDEALNAMPIPYSYHRMPDSGLPSAVLELGQLYAAHAEDVATGTSSAPTFADALRLHRLLDAMSSSTEIGERRVL